MVSTVTISIVVHVLSGAHRGLLRGGWTTRECVEPRTTSLLAPAARLNGLLVACSKGRAYRGHHVPCSLNVLVLVVKKSLSPVVLRCGLASPKEMSPST